MPTIAVTKIGTTSKNQPRVWLEGKKLERENWNPGTSYMIEFYDDHVVVSSDMDNVSSRALGSGTVSRRKKGDSETPIVELRHARLFQLFEPDQKVSVVLREGRIVIRPHEQDIKTRTRERSLLNKIETGQPLRIGSIFHGSGIMDSALHDGLAMQGIATVTEVAVEKVDKYLDNSLTNALPLWSQDSTAVYAGVEELESGHMPQVDMVFMGIPCIGASVAGRAKKATKFAEQCESSGSLIYDLLRFVQNTNPAVAVFECVKPYASSVSAHILRQVLEQMDYTLSERVFNGNEFGALENRDRWVLVAVSKGLNELDLDQCLPLYDKPESLSECLDDIAANDPQWRSFDYLKAKQERDKEKGNCFARQLFNDDSPRVNTITREYQKARSSDCFHQHPTNPELSRLYTPPEHARFKRIPARLVEGLAKTTAHEVLGQSVIYSVFEAIGYHIGQQLNLLAMKEAV